MLISSKINQIIDLAIAEDLGEDGDVTSNLTISQDDIINFQISNRQEIILCGVDFALLVFQKIDKNSEISLKKHFSDGEMLSKDDIIISGSGNARAIFAAERIALNLIQHLSGIATKTGKFVAQLRGDTQILDTRKTIPAFRELQKYAVKIGGGKNHRMNLYESILIKDNHIAAAGGVKKAIEKAKKAENLKIEVECDNLDQVKQVLGSGGVDVVMLDNMNLQEIEKAVKLINKKVKIEVSGNVTLEKIAAISDLGVDYISVGALTHSIEAVDIGLDIIS
ncbi:carboxylating nicotinate-nucleotide diphosphorylase [Rickettsiales bacterium]|nr:carboxylating nicotinate-nucleotide diphosphorylase [Rickettsiales bacterium]